MATVGVDLLTELSMFCLLCSVEDDGQDHFSRFHMRRRSKLPMPKVESDVSVWSLLCKNIGKDLSKISMPVNMNEPLNALQVSAPSVYGALPGFSHVDIAFLLHVWFCSMRLAQLLFSLYINY